MMQTSSSHLPDIIQQTSNQDFTSLQWVGMEKIALPIVLPVEGKTGIACNAFIDSFVSLSKQSKGIHMSRLYLLLNQELAGQMLTQQKLNSLLDKFLMSQDGESQNAMLRLSFDLPLHKKALLSDNYGYQSYPVAICQQLVNGEFKTELELTIPYSSTCPCSASLARQLIAQSIDESFSQSTVDKSELLDWITSKQQSLATPHNQRSYAYIKLQLTSGELPDLSVLITTLEQAIGTPVQTAVKREDEQAFAKLNGENLLFCEDAARRLRKTLDNMPAVVDYQFKVEHQESLHAHNAVVLHQKYPG